MEDKVSSGENMPNLPCGMDELAGELDSMTVEELKAELEILLAEMDEDSFDGELLEAYLDAIDRKSPQSRHMDAQTAYKLFLKRLKDSEREQTPRRGFRGTLKAGLIAAAIAAALAASVAVAHAAGVDLISLIARWTTETFGFDTSQNEKVYPDVPPQLEGMRENLTDMGLSASYLPAYWPEGYEQSKMSSIDGSESYSVVGAYGEKGNRIVLSYTLYYSGKPKSLYNIDENDSELYCHNGISFYIMTNEGKYIAAWNCGSVACVISEVLSYDELVKILDSIGG